MALRVIVHVQNEDPFVAEIDDIPDPKDTFIRVKNPRRRDGKALSFVTDGATSFLYPWTRITFVELIEEQDKADRGDGVIGFFREDQRAGRP
jgi:hypothetical protein